MMAPDAARLMPHVPPLPAWAYGLCQPRVYHACNEAPYCHLRMQAIGNDRLRIGHLRNVQGFLPTTLRCKPAEHDFTSLQRHTIELPAHCHLMIGPAYKAAPLRCRQVTISPHTHWPTVQGYRLPCSTKAAAGTDMMVTPLGAPGSIWAVGKNYMEHIKELPSVGLSFAAEVPQEPVIFLKAGSCALAGPSSSSPGDEPTALPLPVHWSSDLQHEVELAVLLGQDLQPAYAAVAIDLTARDVQAELKRKGYPWTLAKSFPAACPLGSWFELSPQVDLHQLTLCLEVNGAVRQKSSTSHMLFKVPVLLEYLKAHFPVQPGDIILTGTPEGVSTLMPGDDVVAAVTASSTGQPLSRGHWACKAALMQ